MEVNLLRFEHKAIRAKVIKAHYGKDKNYVCFSCGNAVKALRNEGLNVLYIGTKGDLTPNKWYKQKEIREWFNCIDVTSGHLDMEVMLELGKAYRKHLGKLEGTIYVPTGSGETLICLAMAYPEVEFVAVYNTGEETKYEADAPLNALVRRVAREVIIYG